MSRCPMGYRRIEVNQGQTIVSCLRHNGYPGYRAVILLKCKAVMLLRRGKNLGFLAEKDADRSIRKRETICVRDPLPEGCQRVMDSIPASDFRDYAYVFGEDRFTEYNREALQRIDQTKTVIVDLGSRQDPANNLETFIKRLHTGGLVTQPVRHLLVVAHSNNEGVWFIDPFRFEEEETPRKITYEDLETAKEKKLFVISPDLIKPRPSDKHGNDVPAAFHIKGCNIGSDRSIPFLELLQEALGGELYVTAPRHMVAFERHWFKPGLMEYMMYNFTITRPEQLEDHDQAVEAFIDRSTDFRRIDDTVVPDEMWSEWLPKGNVNRTIELRTTVTDPLTNKEVTWKGSEFRYTERFLFQKRVIAQDELEVMVLDGHIRKLPKTHEEKKKAVEIYLRSVDERYHSSHPFPMYERLGHSSMSSFMDGCKWNFRPKKEIPRKGLRFPAVRYDYTLLRPIVDSRNRLYLNFYADKKQKEGLSHRIMLRESDSRFFSIVGPGEATKEVKERIEMFPEWWLRL